VVDHVLTSIAPGGPQAREIAVLERDPTWQRRAVGTRRISRTELEVM
jgi:hypothetical protein